MPLWAALDSQTCFWDKSYRALVLILASALLSASLPTASLVLSPCCSQLTYSETHPLKLPFQVLSYSPVFPGSSAKSVQSYPTLCDPIDGGPPGSPIPGILQAWTRVGCHFLLRCMKGKSESEVAQSYLTLSDPMDCSLPGSSVHGILQTRVLAHHQTLLFHLLHSQELGDTWVLLNAEINSECVTSSKKADF